MRPCSISSYWQCANRQAPPWDQSTPRTTLIRLVQTGSRCDEVPDLPHSLHLRTVADVPCSRARVSLSGLEVAVLGGSGTVRQQDPAVGGSLRARGGIDRP